MFVSQLVPVAIIWAVKKAAIDNMQINEHGCVPIKLFTETNMNFHIILMCQDLIIFIGFLFQTFFKITKTTLGSRLWKYVVTWTWSMTCSLLTFVSMLGFCSYLIFVKQFLPRWNSSSFPEPSPMPGWLWWCACLWVISPSSPRFL